MSAQNGSTQNGSDDTLYDRLVAMGKVRPLSTAGNTACGVFLCAVAALSLAGNGAVVAALCRIRKLRHKPHNILLLNMAAADLLVSLSGYPFTTVSAFYNRFLFGTVVCGLQGFLTFLLAMVAMTSLVFLSLYRYIAVCRPWLKYRITRELTKRCVAVIWAYSVFWTGLPLLGWSRYTLETFGLACSVDWTSRSEPDVLYVCCLIVFCYLLPVGIMAACYFRIVVTALSLRSVTHKVLSIEEATCYHNLRVEVRLSGMCFLLVFFFTVVWSPYTVVSLWSMHEDIPVWAATLPAMFAKLASTMNPYIYVMANPDFRRTLQGKMCLSRIARASSTVHPASSQGGRVGGTSGCYTIDRTKDGIYVGQRTVVINTRDVAMF